MTEMESSALSPALDSPALRALQAAYDEGVGRDGVSHEPEFITLKSAELRKVKALVDALTERNDRLTTALQTIVSWSEAYPLEAFPEPNYPRAARILAGSGITLDQISADCMRHCVSGVGRIAREGLGDA